MTTKTKQPTAAAVMESIEQEAARHGNEPRFVRVLKAGEVVRQGDVYLTPVEGAPKMGAERGSRQVAVGTTTGSRHVADGPSVRVIERPGAGPLEGPYVVAGERWTLTHPEHAHVSLPAGTYGVHYQRDFAAEAVRAVAD